MEHNFLKKGIRELKNLRLSPEEKRAVSVRLMEHVEGHPANIASPWRMYVSNFSFRSALAGLLIMVLTGGSVVSAAEGALPGDLLYPVKVSVTEPLQGAFVSGDVPRARWEAQKTVRRLEEAETLAAQGRLDGASAEAVRNNFKKSADEFNVIVQNASERAPSAELINAAVDFEARIQAHAQILSAVGDAAVNAQASDIASLREAVGEHAERARARRTDTVESFLNERDPQRASATLLMSSEPVLEKSPEKRLEQDSEKSREEGSREKMFDDKVRSVQAMIKDAENRLERAATSTVAESPVRQDILEHVSPALKRAQDDLEDAQEKQGSGDSDSAFSALLDSESAVRQADTSLEQGLKLGKEEKKRRDSKEKERGGDSDTRDSSGRN